MEFVYRVLRLSFFFLSLFPILLSYTMKKVGTELTIALETKNDKFITQLIESNMVNVRKSDAYGWSSLHQAAREGSLPIIIKLIEYGTVSL